MEILYISLGNPSQGFCCNQGQRGRLSCPVTNNNNNNDILKECGHMRLHANPDVARRASDDLHTRQPLICNRVLSVQSE